MGQYTGTFWIIVVVIWVVLLTRKLSRPPKKTGDKR